MHAKYNVILLTFVYQIVKKKKIMFNHVRINPIPVLTKKIIKKIFTEKVNSITREYNNCINLFVFS